MDRILWWAFLQGEPQETWFPQKRSKRQQKRMGRDSGQEWDRIDLEPPFKKARIDENLVFKKGPPQNAIASSSETTRQVDGTAEEFESSERVLVFTEEGEEIEQSTSSQIKNSTKQAFENGCAHREVTPAILSLLEPVGILSLSLHSSYVLVLETTSSTHPFFHLLD